MNVKFWKNSLPSAPRLAPRASILLTDPAWPDKLNALRDRLSNTQPGDALMDGLLGLLDAFVRAELDPLTTAGLDDAEVNRLRGRVGMLLDLKAELTKLWREELEKVTNGKK